MCARGVVFTEALMVPPLFLGAPGHNRVGLREGLLATRAREVPRAASQRMRFVQRFHVHSVTRTCS